MYELDNSSLQFDGEFLSFKKNDELNLTICDLNLCQFKFPFTRSHFLLHEIAPAGCNSSSGFSSSRASSLHDLWKRKKEE